MFLRNKQVSELTIFLISSGEQAGASVSLKAVFYGLTKSVTKKCDISAIFHAAMNF
jgi:hypothetical protein